MAVHDFQLSGWYHAGPDDDPLPAIDCLQISGDAYPGRELQACGYSINGTTSCNFEVPLQYPECYLRSPFDGEICHKFYQLILETNFHAFMMSQYVSDQ